MTMCQRFSALAVVSTLCVLVGCDGGEGSAPSEAALPKFDADAKYNGRTLAECAEGLSDLSSQRRAQALKDIANFGVNGLPMREQVRKVATSDQDEKLRVAAFGVLFNMKDPRAPDLMRDALKNPQAVTSARAWVELTNGAAEMLEKDRLAAAVTALAKENPEHAEHLLSVGTFSRAADARIALATAIMGNEKSDKAVVAITSMLTQLDLSDEKRIEYIGRNLQRLPNKSVALGMLRQIGGDEAFDVALTMIDSDETMAFNQKVAAMSGFARHKVTPAKIVGALAVMAGGSDRKEQELQQLFGSMQSVVSQARTGAAADPDAAKTHLAALTNLAESENVKARSLAVLYLISGVTSKLLEPVAALGPVLVRLQKDDQEIVLGTAIQQMQQMMSRMRGHDLGDLAKEMAETMYARAADDKWAVSVADGMINAFNGALGSTSIDLATGIAAVHEQAKAHKGHPVNVRTLTWFLSLAPRYTKQLGPKMVELSSAIGNLFLDDAISQAEVERLVGQTNLSRLTVPGYAHSAESIIAFAEPMVMSGAPKLTGQYGRRVIGSGLLGGSVHLFKDETEKQKYIEFMERMAEEGSPAFRLSAVTGLTFYVYRKPGSQPTRFAHFTREIGGKVVRIKPALSVNAKPVEPAVVATGAEDEALLMRARNPSGLGRVFGRVDDLKHAFDVVFIDEAGKAIQVTSIDDPSIVKEHNRAKWLVHDTARAVLLLPKGKCAVKVGDQTPLEPAFLASW